MKIKYYENRLNLSWRPILKTILDDPDKFLEDGGWEFLNADASDEEAGSDEESDAYEPSDEEAASESSEVRPTLHRVHHKRVKANAAHRKPFL